MKSTIKSVEEYIDSYPGPVKNRLLTLRRTILGVDPRIAEKIAWGAPTYYLDGYLAQFATGKNHIGFYTSPAAIAAFSEELKGYKTNAKNTVQFSMDQEIPAALVEQMVKFRIEEEK